MSEGQKTTAELRSLAARARQLASILRPNDETARRLLKIADEFEAEADALERLNRC